MSTRTRQILAGLGLALLASSAAQAADVGVSVTVGQPGFYGRIDIGNGGPNGAVIYPRPVIIREVHSVRYEPLYLRVPPGHEKHWHKHCARYEACGRPVYFVREDWYRRHYAERREERREERWEGRREERWEDRRDEGRGEHRGDDHGRGHGHGRGHDRD